MQQRRARLRIGPAAAASRFPQYFQAKLAVQACAHLSAWARAFLCMKASNRSERWARPSERLPAQPKTFSGEMDSGSREETRQDESLMPVPIQSERKRLAPQM